MLDAGKPLDRTFLSIAVRLKRVASGIVPPKEVEDIVQEAYVRACQADRKSTIEAPQAFLFRTVRNLALDYVKRAESRLSDRFDGDEAWQLDQTPFGADPEGQTVSNEEFSLFCKAVRTLPAQCRRAFVLKKVYGYSRREIAEEMGVSENTVQTQIARGMKLCMQFMERVEHKGLGKNVIKLNIDSQFERHAEKDELR